MIKKTYAVAAMATIAIGAAVGAVQFTANPAAAQAGGATAPKTCVAKDAAGRGLFRLTPGYTVLFVPRGDALMRDRGGPQTSYEPTVRNRVASIDLTGGCRAVLYGQFGAAWGHRWVNTSGPTGVPANHIGGVKCECQ